MKALILAAGIGSRLAPITNDRPKSLVKVNGTPILFKQIDNLYRNNITDIIIVSGYKSDMLVKKVHTIYPQIKIIENVDYETTNNMYSAYMAREAIQNEAFLMMNADVFCDSSVITSLLTCESPNAIVTDIGNYVEESMKVVEKDGRLVAISKTIKEEDALGTSIDIYKFSVEAGNAFMIKCAEYIEKEKKINMWSEVALNDILSEVIFKACTLNGRWFEIDNHKDLAEAEKIFVED